MKIDIKQEALNYLDFHKRHPEFKNHGIYQFVGYISVSAGLKDDEEFIELMKLIIEKGELE